MRKRLALFSCFALLLCGCSSSEKSSSLWVVYGIAMLLSFAIFGAYACLRQKKDPWYLLLLGSVAVVNCGYLLLALSQSLSQALWANRLSYLGSVCLPFSMFMIIAEALQLRRPKWLPRLLMSIGILVFLVAATPGVLPIYYKEVTFLQINGVGTLEKEYGALHLLYYVYLFGYFGTMVVLILRKRSAQSPVYSVLLAMAVFANIGVWLLEQFVKLQFELLSLFYILSELFLLGLLFLKKDVEKNAISSPAPEEVYTVDREQLALYEAGLATLTKKEKAIFDCYVEGLSTPDILEKLSIKENTLKFHNKNLYGKLGVSGRKELLAIHKATLQHSN